MLGQRSPYTGREIEEVVDEKYYLFDADGDKIGDIVEFGPEYAVARKDGGLFGEERVYYVPRREIAREDGTDWYLSIDKDELDDMDWSERPEIGSRTDYEASGSTRGDRRVEGEGVRLVRYEEELDAQKTSRQAGEAVVRKDVVEEIRTIDVPVRREELRVERRPVTGDAAPASGDAFTGDTIRVPLMEEQVEVRKVARPVEEIEIGKVAVEETQRVEDTVRKERFDIDDSQVAERGPDEPTDR